MYTRYRFVQYAAVCHYRLFVYISGVPDWMKPCHRVENGGGKKNVDSCICSISCEEPEVLGDRKKWPDKI